MFTQAQQDGNGGRMTEFDRLFYDTQYSPEYPGWVAVRLRGHKYPVGWAQSIPDAVADLKHWIRQQERWAK
jgi:hypothetical protein